MVVNIRYEMGSHPKNIQKNMKYLDSRNKSISQNEKGKITCTFESNSWTSSIKSKHKFQQMGIRSKKSCSKKLASSIWKNKDRDAASWKIPRKIAVTQENGLMLMRKPMQRQLKDNELHTFTHKSPCWSNLIKAQYTGLFVSSLICKKKIHWQSEAT